MHYLNEDQFKTTVIFLANMKEHKNRIKRLLVNLHREQGYPQFCDKFLTDYCNGVDEIFIAVCSGVDVGLLLLNNFEYGKIIDVVYIQPDYRGRQFATAMYNHVLLKHGATAVFSLLDSLTAEKISYWKSIGFKSITVEFGPNNAHLTACILSTHETIPIAPLSLALSFENIPKVKELFEKMTVTVPQRLV